MRAGLLSDSQVIRTINERFVSTTITYSDLKEKAKAKDALAVEVAAHFVGPVELIFLTPDGRFLTKLHAVDDFNHIHPDTSLRPGQQFDPGSEHNVRVFLKCVEDNFGKIP